MSEELYSVEQVAERLGLHVRTVRGYVREGRLKAVRIGKQYRISRADLEAFTGGSVGSPLRETVRRERHIEVSSIVQIDAVSPELASRLTNVMIGTAKGRREGADPRRIETIYDPQRGSLKIIVIGPMRATAEVFQIVEVLIDNER